MDVSESIEEIWDSFLEAMSHESEKDRNHWFIDERFCHFFRYLQPKYWSLESNTLDVWTASYNAYGQIR